MKRLILPFFIGMLFMLSTCKETSPHAIIKTDMGDIKVKLFVGSSRTICKFHSPPKQESWFEGE